MISTLFAKFRHQYANGTLTSELLMPHAEEYLVKATISIGEQPIATALAAGSDLAEADDLAKARVLAMLGLAENAQDPAPRAIVSDQTPRAAISSAEAEETVPTMAAKPPQLTPSPTAEVSPTEAAKSSEDISDSDDDMGRPLDSFTPDEAPAPSEVPASSLAASAIENFDDTHPVDLSDIIAQTDVEMARLGWSSAQGRGYLEKTFDKRSRQQLTDEELLTFLLYLESQATPNMG